MHSARFSGPSGGTDRWSVGLFFVCIARFLWSSTWIGLHFYLMLVLSLCSWSCCTGYRQLGGVWVVLVACLFMYDVVVVLVFFLILEAPCWLN